MADYLRSASERELRALARARLLSNIWRSMIIRLVVGVGVAATVLIRFAHHHRWEPSTLAGWFGAVGSLTAATCALGIATRDRHDRERERSSAAQAQARLVCVAYDPLDDQTGVRLSVVNYGREPIMNVLIAYRDSQRDHLEPPRPWGWKYPRNILQILPPAANGSDERSTMRNTLTAEIPLDSPDSMDHLLVVLEFRDADGAEWRTVHNCVRQVEEPARRDVDRPHSFLERLFTSSDLIIGYGSPFDRTFRQPTLRGWTRFRNRLSVVLWGCAGGKARIRRRVERKMRRRHYQAYVAYKKSSFAPAIRRTYFYRLNQYLRTGQWPKW